MCNEPDEIEASKGQFLVYQTEDGRLKLNVRLEDETVWLTQQRMAELFQSSKQNISHHISSIFDEGELSPEATVKNYLTVQLERSEEHTSELQSHSFISYAVFCLKKKKTIKQKNTKKKKK